MFKTNYCNSKFNDACKTGWKFKYVTPNSSLVTITGQKTIICCDSVCGVNVYLQINPDEIRKRKESLTYL